MLSKFWKLARRFAKKPYNQTRRKEYFRYFAKHCIDVRDILGIEERSSFFEIPLNVDPMKRILPVYSILLYFIDPSNTKYEWDSFKLICGGISSIIHHPRFQLRIFKD